MPWNSSFLICMSLKCLSLMSPDGSRNEWGKNGKNIYDGIVSGKRGDLNWPDLGYLQKYGIKDEKLALEERQSEALSSINTFNTMLLEFGRVWGTEVP